MTQVIGRVKVRSAGAAGGATVEVHNAAGDVVDQVVANDEGAFTYYLSSGRWTFRAWDAWGHRGRGDVTVNNGEDTARVELEIS